MNLGLWMNSVGLFKSGKKVVQCMRQHGITDRSIIVVFAPVISKIFQAFPHSLGVFCLKMFLNPLGV